MGTTKVFRHQNYEVLCSASPGDSGKYVPRLVVSKQAWPTRPRIIAVARGDHLNEETAIDAAHAQGIEWIANYG